MARDSSSASSTPQSVVARVFTSNKSSLNSIRAFAALFALAAIGLPLMLEANQSPLVIGLLCSAFAVVFLVYTELYLARRRLTITETEVEYRTVMGVRRLSLAEIKGFRRGGDAERPSLILVPVEAGQKILTIPLNLGKPGEIEYWASQRFADLQVIETKADLEQILADETFGLTLEERRSFYDRQQRLFKILIGVSIAGLLWAFVPRPYEWVIALQYVVIIAVLAEAMWSLRSSDSRICGVTSRSIDLGDAKAPRGAHEEERAQEKSSRVEAAYLEDGVVHGIGIAAIVFQAKFRRVHEATAGRDV